MINARLEALNDYPFRRLAELLADVAPRPNEPPIAMSVGEPQHDPPALLHEIVAKPHKTWNRYPPMEGTPEFRQACADWLTRRFRLPPGAVDAAQGVVPIAGSREGLFHAALLAVTPVESGPKPIALMPNPFYQVYLGAAVLAGAEPRFLPTTRATGFLPDLGAIDAETLARTEIMYLCSPANPQGSVASLDYLKRALALARAHDFLLVCDECYSEIYTGDAAPPGGLEAGAALGPGPGGHRFDNLIVFHTLSKRSSAPGLRSGFAAGHPHIVQRLHRLRSYSCAATPLPLLEAATALWRDEAHVEATRALYRAKFDLAESVLAGRCGFYRPGGGFYLWLDVGDGEATCRRLWREAAIRSLPGRYITQPNADGSNDGAPYLRLALVHDLPTTETALKRLAALI